MMTTALANPAASPVPAKPAAAAPAPADQEVPAPMQRAMADGVYRFTIDEYFRMADAGILGPDDKTELLDGVIYKKPISRPEHAFIVDFTAQQWRRRLQDHVYVRTQHPLLIQNVSVPEPDILLANPPAEHYLKRHPRPEDVLLLIEVADSSHQRDRQVKRPLYAAGGIGEYWVLDVEKRLLEVCRGPGNGRYHVMETYDDPKAEVACEAFGDVKMTLGDLLPAEGDDDH